jgi:hypothetical protein
MGLRDRLVDPKSPDRRPRRAAYALPTLFTAGNIFLGYLSILASFRGAMLAAVGGAGAADEFAMAAKTIGAAVFLDGLDGRIARMTNTTSDFGREMDSLADAVSFGMAPAVLAFSWGVQFLGAGMGDKVRSQIFNAGYFISFLFLLCGACGWRASTCRRIRFRRTPVARIANTSSVCRFRRRRAWWRQSCGRSTRSRSPGGRSPLRGWACCCCSVS